MVKLDYFHIQLQNPSGIYRPGEAVIGTVNYRVTKRGKINRVFLVACGDGYVHWTERRNSGNSSYTVSYTGYEKFFEFQQVYQSKSGKDDFYLEEGDYCHPFQFILPPLLPSSFEGVGCRNRYTITGTVDIPWSFNKYCQRVFGVISNIDLNLIPAIGNPCTVTQSKTVCCMCCKSDPIVMTLSIRKGGYVPGETIICDVSVVNPSSRRIHPPTIVIGQTMIMNATTKSRVVNHVLASLNLPKGIEKKSSEEYNGIQIVVPPACPSTLNTSRVLQISYNIDLKISISGPTIGGGLSIPIVIGTIPIGGIPNQQAIDWSFQPNPAGTENPAFVHDAPKGEAFESNAKSFKPQYPYYKDFSVNS